MKSFKKIVMGVLATLSVCSFTMGLISCVKNEPANQNATGDPACEHTFTKVATSVTCTKEGIDSYECSLCGAAKLEKVPALGHDIKAVPAKAATCVEAGWNAYEQCSRCSYTTKVEVAKLAHTLVDVEAKEATCTEIGYEAYKKCSLEGCTYTEEYKEIAALDHNLVDVPEFAATDETDGYEAYKKCDRTDCKYIEGYVVIPSTGHDIQYIDKQDPDCDNIGWYTYQSCVRDDCVICKAHKEGDPSYMVDSNGQLRYTVDYVEIPAIGHDYELKEGVQGSCIVDGYADYSVCKVCGHSTKEIVYALGHQIEKLSETEVTCTENGITTYQCTVCGESWTEIVFAQGHDYFEKERVEAEPDKVCIETGKIVHGCYNCEMTWEESIKPLGHDKVEDVAARKEASCSEEGSATYYCSVCSHKLVEVLPMNDTHNYEDGKCVDCGKLQPSEGLVYELSEDKTHYIITGIGSFTGDKLVIPTTYTYTNLETSEEVDLPVAVIAYAAFKDASFTTVDIVGNVTSIGDEAFMNCTNLKSVTIHADVEEIGCKAFENCTALEEVTLSASVNKIDAEAFKGATSLTKVTFGTTEGWLMATVENAVNGVAVSVETLTNAEDAAKFIKDNDYYFWFIG